ncbi:MAG: DUF2200 domain-containing protein [Planctomycetes bacterium]|nr:DUF2200 domain-containing protein [Planctomycetota bacterium]
MKSTSHHDERIANMTMAAIYPLYVNKIEKKGRTVSELDQVIEWLTGYDKVALQKSIDDGLTFKQFFEQAQIHPNVDQIKGVVCGYRVEDIENKLTQQVRYLDKLVGELARGRKMDKILRNG